MIQQPRQFWIHPAKELLDGFKGTKEEWAEYWIEYQMIPSAKDYDNTETEFALRWLLAEVRRLRAGLNGEKK